MPKSELFQKLLTLDDIPGAHSTNIISDTIHARTCKKYFFQPIFNGESIDIYC